MEFDQGLSAFLWVVAIVWIGVLIVQYRKGKRGLAMTAGFILAGLGFAADGLSPAVPPGLKFVPIKASMLSFLLMLLGLLLILGSWLTTRRNMRKG